MGLVPFVLRNERLLLFLVAEFWEVNRNPGQKEKPDQNKQTKKTSHSFQVSSFFYM